MNNLKAATSPTQLDITRTAMMNNDDASDFDVVAGPKAKEPDTDILDTIAKFSARTTTHVLEISSFLYS